MNYSRNMISENRPTPEDLITFLNKNYFLEFIHLEQVSYKSNGSVWKASTCDSSYAIRISNDNSEYLLDQIDFAVRVSYKSERNCVVLKNSLGSYITPYSNTCSVHVYKWVYGKILEKFTPQNLEGTIQCLKRIGESQPKKLRFVVEPELALSEQEYNYYHSLPKILCHGDLSPSNIIQSKSEISPIDFGSICFAPRIYDFQRILQFCIGGGFNQFSLVENLIMTYKKHFDLSNEEKYLIPIIFNADCLARITWLQKYQPRSPELHQLNEALGGLVFLKKVLNQWNERGS